MERVASRKVVLSVSPVLLVWPPFTLHCFRTGLDAGPFIVLDHSKWMCRNMHVKRQRQHRPTVAHDETGTRWGIPTVCRTNGVQNSR